MKYVIEHMEPSISPWVAIEYSNMAAKVGPQNLILSGMSTELIEEKKAQFSKVVMTQESVGDWDQEVQKKVLLLDPSSKIELCPKDAGDYEFLLFGGILGDDPPQDRTGILRKMGFVTRHLGAIQMTTDTAVLVAQQVLEFQRPLESIKWVDHPDIKLSKKESVSLPFRFMADDNGEPMMAPGLVDHLKEQQNDVVF